MEPDDTLLKAAVAIIDRYGCHKILQYGRFKILHRLCAKNIATKISPESFLKDQ